MTHEKEIKELIEAGEKITNNEWFNVTIKDASHVENEGILSTKIKGVELEEEVILLSCQEDLDGNAWNNMHFIANAANSRPAIKAMYEENLRLKAENEWQPIETAPKDGTTILTWQKGFKPATSRWVEKTTPKHGYKSSGWYDSGFDAKAFPTHWKPIPTPPQENE